MTQAVMLTEERIVNILQGLSGPARRSLLDELLLLAAEPGCAESQADGVPCASVHTSCDQCQKYRDLLAAVRRRVLA